MCICMTLHSSAMKPFHMFSKTCFTRLPWLHQMRHLSTDQLNVALRPFYFSVHPDLFGQHPRPRAVNEESLKVLHAYLDKYRTQQQVKPARISFYLRPQQLDIDETLPRSNFQCIEVSLSPDLHDTVRSILRSCDLPLQYIDSIPKQQTQPSSPGRPIQWHHTYYTHYGIKNPYVDEHQTKIPEITISWWLRKNYKRALQYMVAAEPIRKNIEGLKVALCAETGLCSVCWQCEWGWKQYRTSLSRLQHLLTQAQHQLHPSVLKGHSLVFGNETGICLRGNVILSSKDVPQTWLKFLSSLGRYDRILKSIPLLEKTLSSLLNDIEVYRRIKGPLVMATQYEMQLRKLIRSLSRFRLQLSEQSMAENLSHLQLVVECATGPITISPTGKILVPDDCPGFLVVDFINRNAHKAAEVRQGYEKLRRRELDGMEECKSVFSLKSLQRDANVTTEQMTTCCERLIAEPRNVGSLFHNARVKVSKFYSVMSDGEMIIPWNWKGKYD